VAARYLLRRRGSREMIRFRSHVILSVAKDLAASGKVARSFAALRMTASALVLIALLCGCQREQPPLTSKSEPPSAEQPGPWNLPGKPPYLIAHYMPWFSTAPNWSHWKWDGAGTPHDPNKTLPDGRRDIAAAHYPLIGPYDSSDPAVVRYHLRTAQAAGISVFACIWYGPKSDTDQRIPLLLDEAQRIGMRIAICYEEKINFPDYRAPESREDVVRTATEDLTYLVNTYASHPAYLTRDGKPFVFQFNSWGTRAFGPNYLTPTEWDEVFAKLPRPILYGRQNLDEDYHPPIAAAYVWWTEDAQWPPTFARRASELRDAGRLAFFMTMICPGFDDSGVNGWGNAPRIVERQGLKVLHRTMEHALDGSPELVQIVTWNDFNEGTEVEPTREHQFQYLDAIETWWGQKTGRPVNLDDNRAAFDEFKKKTSTNRHESSRMNSRISFVSICEDSWTNSSSTHPQQARYVLRRTRRRGVHVVQRPRPSCVRAVVRLRAVQRQQMMEDRRPRGHRNGRLGIDLDPVVWNLVRRVGDLLVRDQPELVRPSHVVHAAVLDRRIIHREPARHARVHRGHLEVAVVLMQRLGRSVECGLEHRLIRIQRDMLRIPRQRRDDRDDLTLGGDRAEGRIAQGQIGELAHHRPRRDRGRGGNRSFSGLFVVRGTNLKLALLDRVDRLAKLGEFLAGHEVLHDEISVVGVILHLHWRQAHGMRSPLVCAESCE